MALIGRLLKGRRAGGERLAWEAPNFACARTLSLTSPAFADGEPIPVAYASKRAGGRDQSPALAWSQVPSGTEQLLLVIEDPDVPMRVPFIHCVALIEPSVTSLPDGALNAHNPAPGVRLLRSTMGRGYLGPAPIKSHGPHRYVFQLFALAKPVPLPSNATTLESAKPRQVLAAVADVLARGRLDGLYERP
ncbi:MAG: YbhB/YbcL family Raf kinase inhibitor-like protein [Actinomycetota bacterium]|jgi:Raf kinase inhibitor-like YbhB/YbcL family protein|nr:YbhB/YbcL family Raf kinase inhibitor-like protein [Actinomycetota bacterium]